MIAGDLGAVAARVDDLELGIPQEELGGQFATGEAAGQNEIGKQQADFVAVLAPDLEGLGASGGFEDAIAEAGENVLHGGADEEIVFEEKDGFVTAANRGQGRVGNRFAGGRGEMGEIDAESGPLADFAVNVDPSLVLLNDAEDRGEAEAGAFADFLGSEEWLENLLKQFRRNPGSGVGDAKTDESAGPALGDLRGRGVIEFDERGLDEEASAVGHGVAGVNGEVEQDLVDHAGVGVDHQGIGGELELHLNVLAEDAVKHLGHVDNDFIQVQIACLHRLLAAEEEQLTGEVGGPLGGFLDFAGDGLGARGKAFVERHHPGLHHDDGENVVEVVGNAAGQLADGFHFLRLAQLGFELSLLGDVAKGPDATVVSAAFVTDGRRVAVEDAAIGQFDFVAADFVRVSVEVSDPFGELTGILGLAGGEMNLRGVVWVGGERRGNFPQFDHLLILENFFTLTIHDGDAIEGGIDLGLEEGGFPADLAFGIVIFLAQALLLEGALDGAAEAGDAILKQVVGGPVAHGLDGDVLADRAENEDEGDVQAAFAEKIGRAQARETGHGVVGEDDVGKFLDGDEEIGLGLDAGPDGIEAGAAEFAEQHFGIVRDILDNQDSKGLGHSSSHGGQVQSHPVESEVLHGFGKQTEINGFDDVAVDAESVALDDIGLFAGGGQHDHGDGGGAGIILDLAQNLEAVDLGKFEIHEDEPGDAFDSSGGVGAAAEDKIEGLDAIAGDVKTRGGLQFAKSVERHVEIVGIILDEKQVNGVGLVHVSFSAARVKKKVAP